VVINVENRENSRYCNKEMVMFVVLTFSLLVLVLGTSLAIFTYLGKGKTSNSLKTGSLTFAYSDSVGGSNGIYIDNARPISDEEGKNLSGNREYFDFVITATTSYSPISYEVIATKGDISTLKDSDIKLYLTVVNGSSEVDTPITSNNGVVTLFSELHDTKNNDFTGKSIYFETIEPSNNTYNKRFRLRMWIDNKLYDEAYLLDKVFSVRVNVSASN